MAGESERNRIFSGLEERFGIPRMLFGDYLLFKRGGGWWLLKNQSPLMAACQLKVWKTGLKAFQRVGSFVKPTTRMIQVFGRFATRGQFRVTGKGLSKLLEGGELPSELPLENGYVILTLSNGTVLGLGLLIRGKVRSQLPRKEIDRVLTDPWINLREG